MIEAKVSVVRSIHSKFSSDIADFDSFQGLVGFFVSELDDERVDTVAFSLSVELSDDDGMICSLRHCEKKDRNIKFFFAFVFGGLTSSGPPFKGC